MVAFNKLFDEIWIGYTVILIVGFIELLRNKEYRSISLSLVLFAIFFPQRYLYYIQSRRYYSIYIIISLVCISFFLIISKKKANRLFISFGIILISLIQLVKCYTQDNNSYFIYINESCNKIINKSLFTFYSQKYQNYLNIDYDYCLPIPNFYESSVDGYQSFLKKYPLDQKDNIILISNKKSIAEELYSSFPRHNRKVLMKINHINKQRSFYIFKLSPTPNSKIMISHSDTNLIQNGEFELYYSHDEKVRKLKDRIVKGQSFYSNEDILFPISNLLLTNNFSLTQYTKVFLTNDSIDGNFSLNVHFNQRDSIYLMNRVDSVPGILSCKIKKIDSSNSISTISIE